MLCVLSKFKKRGVKVLKSITLKILENVSRSVLTCNECKEKLEFYGMAYLKMIANEKGWQYDEDADMVYCWDCQEKIKNKKV